MVTAPAAPTALVRFADAGDLYVTWRWTHALDSPGVSVIPRAQVADAMAALTAARPGAPDGHLAAYATELGLAARLARTLVPYGLALNLHQYLQRGVRPLLRIQPAPSIARVPWELLALDSDPEIRLLEVADVSALAPASVVHAPARVRRPWSAGRELPLVAVLDPRVPGFGAGSRLGSVLGPVDPGAPLVRRLAEHARAGRLRLPVPGEAASLFRRADTDRDWLSAALRAGASRLLYTGHVTAADPAAGSSEDARLHLSCPATLPGHAPALRGHRPLAAKDLLLDPARWPMPGRVALIACESGGDPRFADALGLTSATLHAGAELVTATRWPLPTDHALALAGADPAARPLQEAIRAIDTAHESEDPVRALAGWQRERLTAWRRERTIEHAPLLWGAFTTTTG